MNQAHLLTIRDFEDGCPVSAETLDRLYRADAATLDGLIEGIPERTHVRLAVLLYGRTHTRELGVRVATTCEADHLAEAAGALGKAIYAQSRNGYAHSTYGDDRRPAKGAISLAGSRSTRDQHA